VGASKSQNLLQVQLYLFYLFTFYTKAMERCFAYRLPPHLPLAITLFPPTYFISNTTFMLTQMLVMITTRQPLRTEGNATVSRGCETFPRDSFLGLTTVLERLNAYETRLRDRCCWTNCFLIRGTTEGGGGGGLGRHVLQAPAISHMRRIL
jgi:hypothetical protein